MLINIIAIDNKNEQYLIYKKAFYYINKLKQSCQGLLNQLAIMFGDGNLESATKNSTNGSRGINGNNLFNSLRATQQASQFAFDNMVTRTTC